MGWAHAHPERNPMPIRPGGGGQRKRKKTFHVQCRKNFAAARNAIYAQQKIVTCPRMNSKGKGALEVLAQQVDFLCQANQIYNATMPRQEQHAVSQSLSVGSRPVSRIPQSIISGPVFNLCSRAAKATPTRALVAAAGEESFMTWPSVHKFPGNGKCAVCGHYNYEQDYKCTAAVEKSLFKRPTDN